IGNRLMMDDGIGIYLTEELQGRNKEPRITYLVGESDIDFCLDQMEDEKFLIILDAVYTDKPPGTVSLFSLADLSQHQPLQLSPHNLHLFHMFSQKNCSIKGLLIGIEPHDINFHLGLSPVLLEKWLTILQKVETLIHDLVMEG
ncbi:MAG TPA: hydrogenase maturation protease, partial [Paenibacillaceae bacterium]|nr:hydrogenase maturation protease [Paenibacillaceae bacterium]